MTWVASDWLLLQIDEIRNREEMIETLRLGLDDLQTATHHELMAGYDALMSVWYASAEAEISQSFVPLDSLRSQPLQPR